VRQTQILGEYLALDDAGYLCRRCGHRFCGRDDLWKRHARFRESPCREDVLGAPVSPREDGAVVFRQFFCPGCLTEVDNEVALAGSPLRWSFRPPERPTDGGRA